MKDGERDFYLLYSREQGQVLYCGAGFSFRQRVLITHLDARSDVQLFYIKIPTVHNIQLPEELMTQNRNQNRNLLIQK
jgi:hypothetical protein